MDNKILDALKKRKEIKKRNPVFNRQESDTKSKLGWRRKKKQKWRAPKGRHSKVRKMRKGYQARVKIGYGKPGIVRGYIKDLIPRLVNNVNEILLVKENEIAIISAKVGMKKKIEMIKKASEKGIKIMNGVKNES